MPFNAEDVEWIVINIGMHHYLSFLWSFEIEILCVKCVYSFDQWLWMRVTYILVQDARVTEKDYCHTNLALVGSEN
jgi:hypothetical protein